MAKWYLIETKDGDQFETDLSAKDKADAILTARAIYDALSDHDKIHTTEAYICLADKTEDGIIDLDGATDFSNVTGGTGYVVDDDGQLVDFAAASALMDDEIREDLHDRIAPCSNQKFFDTYCGAHEEKFGEAFRV